MLDASPTSRPLLTLFLLALVSGCGASDTLPAYRCISSIDGANESGGEITSVDKVAYVAGFATIAVFDLTQPDAPQTLTPLAMPARVEAVAAANGRLVAATSNTLHLFDVSNPRAPVKLGEVQTSTVARNALATDGRYAYAGTPSGGVLAFELTSGAPVFVTATTVGGTLALTDLLIQGDVLYAAGGAPSGLVALDISQRTRPVPQPVLDVKANPIGLTLSDSALWALTNQAVEGHRGARIDLKQPLSPTLGASSADTCACTLNTFSSQATSAHGHLIAVTYGGTGLGAWRHGSLAGSLMQESIGTCGPVNRPLVNVHAVGEVLVATGSSVITFLAP
jgi:hypothetical protein